MALPPPSSTSDGDVPSSTATADPAPPTTVRTPSSPSPAVRLFLPQNPFPSIQADAVQHQWPGSMRSDPGQQLRPNSDGLKPISPPTSSHPPPPSPWSFALPPEPTRPSPPPLMNPATASRPRVVTVCQLRRRPSVLSASPDLASRNRSAIAIQAHQRLLRLLLQRQNILLSPSSHFLQIHAQLASTPANLCSSHSWISLLQIPKPFNTLNSSASHPSALHSHDPTSSTPPQPRSHRSTPAAANG